MKFGPVPVADAQGCILAHSIAAALPPYQKQLEYKIRKGVVLTAQHVADLSSYGHADVIVAKLEPDDVPEDEAAARLAGAIAPDPMAKGLVIGPAGTGRVNIKAGHAGIVRVEAAAINALNTVNPMLTLATLPQWQRVVAGQIVATVKVISYAVGAGHLDAACAAAGQALSVMPTQVASGTLIETAVTDGIPSDKGRRAIATRLGRLSVELSERVVVPHQMRPLAQALDDAPGEVLMILTGSATSDIRDTAPEAVRAAGGTVHHFGMPVDPGNLLFIGDLKGKPVIGLPGCARSLSLNGADWVLERILCGVPVTGADIAAMGVGGLLKDIPQRGLPRESKG